MKESEKSPKADNEKLIEKENQDTEETGENNAQDRGVLVSEEFQKKAHEIISKANKHEVRHVHDRANHREDELRKEEREKEMKGKKKGEYSMDDAPSSLGY